MNHAIEDLLIIDIETAAEAESFENLTTQKQRAWRDFYESHPHLGKTVTDAFKRRAALYPEFAKVVCVSMAWWKEGKLYLQGFPLEVTEYNLLVRLDMILARDTASRDGRPRILAGHGIGRFDIPFIGKRRMINGVAAGDNSPFNLYGRAVADDPFMYRTDIYDTMDKWSFGQDTRTSLRTLCAALGVFDPKLGMSGEDVHAAFYEDNKTSGLQKIVEYGNGDAQAEALCIYRLETGRHWNGPVEEII